MMGCKHLRKQWVWKWWWKTTKSLGWRSHQHCIQHWRWTRHWEQTRSE